MEKRIEGILFDGRSLGGIGTTLAFPEMDLTIDLGVCTPAALRTGTVAFTHTHADHMSGLLTYLGVRRLFGMKYPRLIVPSASAADLRDLVAAMGRLQGRPFEATVEETKLGTDLPLGNNLFLHSFRTEHNVPGLGLSVVRRVEKLKQQYLGLDGSEIARRKKEPGADLFRIVDDPLVAVTGDTQVEGLDLDDPAVSRAKVLFIECTFIDEQRSPEYAHLGGHSHLDELVQRLKGLECGAIVFFHFSQIYKRGEIEKLIHDKLPEDVAGKAHVLLPEEDDRL